MAPGKMESVRFLPKGMQSHTKHTLHSLTNFKFRTDDMRKFAAIPPTDILQNRGTVFSSPSIWKKILLFIWTGRKRLSGAVAHFEHSAWHHFS